MYRSGPNEGRISSKVGTPHNIENDLVDVFFFENLFEQM